jgi:hypothetical protein
MVEMRRVGKKPFFGAPHGALFFTRGAIYGVRLLARICYGLPLISAGCISGIEKHRFSDREAGLQVAMS